MFHAMCVYPCRGTEFRRDTLWTLSGCIGYAMEHNLEIARYSSRNITLRDERVTGDVYNANILDAAVTLASLPVEEE